MNRPNEALDMGQHAIDLEPLSLRVNQNFARLLFFQRQYDRATDQFRKTLELDPNYPPAHEWLGYVYEQKGQQREAVAEWSKALNFSGASEQALILDRTYVASGFEAAIHAVAQMQLAKLNERKTRGDYVPTSDFVNAYTRMGDKEQALALLDKAMRERNQFALDVKNQSHLRQATRRPALSGYRPKGRILAVQLIVVGEDGDSSFRDYPDLFKLRFFKAKESCHIDDLIRTYEVCGLRAEFFHTGGKRAALHCFRDSQAGTAFAIWGAKQAEVANNHFTSLLLLICRLIE